MQNILIVDDQPHLQYLFREELQEDYSIHGITDAKAVGEYLGVSKPNLVLLDLYLNGFEGWEILHDIKSSYPDLPVLIVTAYDNYADDPRLSEADGYVIKKFDAINNLKQKIAEVLEQHHP